MIADASLDAQAERTDLARRRTVRVAPAARVAVPPRRDDAVGGAGRDERRLEGTHERADQEAPLVKPDDGIRHELAGPVVGDLAATLGSNDRDAASGELLVAREDVGRVRLPAEGQDGGMLQQQELVADRACRALIDEPLLQRVGIAVGHATQPLGTQRRRLTGRLPGGRIRTGIDQRGLHRATIAGACPNAVRWGLAAMAGRIAR